MDEELEPVTVPEDNSQNDSGEEEEEEECRVCRGPAEEGRPLFSPCKCSGSIGLTHQDCLTSWLAVTRGEGRCELCKVKFHFAPQYAENAPDRLSVTEVLVGLARRAVAKWLPFLLRLAFCVSLWLLIAPLFTAYLYLIWMNRSLTCVKERWKWKLLPADTVSGAVLAAMILISFLSLMSFADFLRVEWQQQQNQQQRNDPAEAHGGRRFRREVANAVDEDRRRQHEVDNGLLIRFNQERAERADNNHANEDGGNGIEYDDGQRPGNQGRENEAEQNQQDAPAGIAQNNIPNGLGAIENDNNNDNDNNNNVDEDEDAAIHHREERNNARPPPREVPPARQVEFRGQRNRPERAADANMNLDPLLQEDQVDMEINVALDELLGLRGPISALLRNLLWLLVFNTVYLGFFAFIPRTIGSAVYSNIFNTTVFEGTLNYLPLINAENENMIALRKAIADINEESESLNTIFRLPDFAAVNLGYLFCATLVIMVRLGWILSQRCRGSLQQSNRGNSAAVAGGREGDPGRAVARDEVQRLGNAIGDHEHPGLALGEAVGLVLDATVAVVKVGILLFLKMFLLPVLLGIWLDGSSMELFGNESRDRILYAGKDLFSFVLLHWVAGITFMLLVTVSVLQLREVAHPDLLAHLIRPQEPQPDLLGNLMHDSVLTQTKRMMLSLLIYTALLELHVSIPVKLLMASGITDYLPFLKLKFWHLVMPQLQVPVELLVFHLSMLALLEKYKNSIGEIQHHWLVFTTSKMGLVDYILPKEVERFVLVGHIDVCTSEGGVKQALYDIAEKDGDREALVALHMEKVSPTLPTVEDVGETRDDGERVLRSSQAYISLPARNRSNTDDSDNNNGTTLLPTKVGRYRLKRLDDDTKDSAIEIWKEKTGDPVARPPEGWDDLGMGGADVQGRWAWGKEKQSAIERGVAERLNFMGHSGKEAMSLAGRVLLLLFFSWCATTFLLFVVITAPLGIGRLLYWILRVPERFVHCPLGFALGSCIVFPTVALGTKALMSSTNGNRLRDRLSRWIGSFHLPPARKVGVLLATALFWFLFCPWALGMNYELCLVKTPQWFAGEEKLVDLESILLSWMVGTVLLNTWACLCSFSVFAKEFWVNIGNGMLDAPPNEDDAPPEEHGENGENGENSVAGWQGKDGRLARFFSVWKSVVFRWEWENVDHVVLLVECALPVSRKIGILLAAPVLCCAGWFWLTHAILGLDEVSGQYRLFIYRLAATSTLLVQLSITFRKQIQRWFGVVHKTARDDRYLIGEILLNHQPDFES